MMTVMMNQRPQNIISLSALSLPLPCDVIRVSWLADSIRIPGILHFLSH